MKLKHATDRYIMIMGMGIHVSIKIKREFKIIGFISLAFCCQAFILNFFSVRFPFIK